MCKIYLKNSYKKIQFFYFFTIDIRCFVLFNESLCRPFFAYFNLKTCRKLKKVQKKCVFRVFSFFYFFFCTFFTFFSPLFSDPTFYALALWKNIKSSQKSAHFFQKKCVFLYFFLKNYEKKHPILIVKIEKNNPQYNVKTSLSLSRFIERKKLVYSNYYKGT